jgi:hypothetical protein
MHLVSLLISASVPSRRRAGIKAEMLVTFIVRPEALMQPIISAIAKTAIPYLTKFQLHYYAVSPQI